MTTPNRTQIIERARELWHERQFQKGDPSFSIEPEIEELQEEGFLSVAQSELMRSEHRSEIEYIDFPKYFRVDIKELFESNGLVLGSRHTGKSDVAMMITDKAMKEGAVVVCFDPSLDWIARSSIRQYMKVEPHTVLDVPSESMIYDVSLLSPLEQQRIVEDFSKRLFENQVKIQNRKQYLIIFEESHVYFYQGILRAKHMQNTVKVLSVGRNLDIACVLVSQFPAMLDKFAVKHSISQCWFGFTKEPNDLAYLHRILGENTERLTKLNDGEFMHLTRKGIEKTHIEPYESNIAKTQIKPRRLEIPSLPKPQTKQDNEALVSLAIALMWFVAILLAIMVNYT